MCVSIPGTGVLKCKTVTMAAFKLKQIYPAHVLFDTSSQYITFSTTTIPSQTNDNLGKQLYFNLLLQIQRDSTKLILLLYQLSYNYYILWPLLSEMFSPSKTLIAKLSLFTLTYTFIKCKPLCIIDISEDSRVGQNIQQLCSKDFKLLSMLHSCCSVLLNISKSPRGCISHDFHRVDEGIT